MARLFACNIAAPIACSARKPHSAPRFGASPHSTEASVKTDEAVDVEQLAAPHVGEAADGDDGRHQDQQVRQADPRDGTDGNAEGVLQGGQGDGDDGRIELAHERTDAHGRHGEPVGVAALPYDLGPPRLDQQPVPRPRPRTRGNADVARFLPAAVRHEENAEYSVTSALALMSRDDAPTSTS